MAKPPSAAARDATGSEQPADRTSWRRDEADQDVTSRIGVRIRAFREEQGLTLAQASVVTGMPSATLSRIENSRMSATFPQLLKLVTGLRMPWSELTGATGRLNFGDQISVAMPGQSEQAQVPGYAYAAPHADSPLQQHMQPLIFEVLASTVEEAGGLRGHPGTEFIYVLHGTLVVRFQTHPTIELPTGGSLLFNCNIPHAYISKGRTKAKLLNIVVLDPVLGLPSAPSDIRSLD